MDYSFVAKRYRSKAGELRLLAEGMRASDTRRTLNNLANAYENMAMQHEMLKMQLEDLAQMRKAKAALSN